jgi:PAS domain S-box-containing protein
VERELGERDFIAVKLTVDYAIVRILADAPTLAEATPRILASIGETLGWEFGAIWQVEPGGELLRCVDTWQSGTTNMAEFDQMTRSINFAPGVGVPGRVWASGESAWFEDLSRERNFPRAQTAAAAGLNAAIAVPIRSRSEILGVMEFFAREMREPDEGLLEMMGVVGSQVGQFMERKRVEEEMRKSEALKTAMLEGALDCVIAMDHDGNVLEFNPAAEKTFGYKRDEVIGKEMAALIIPPHLRDRHRRGIARFLAGGEAPVLDKRLELTGMRSDGSEFPVELTVTRIGTDDPPMFTGYVRDITERRRGEEALRFVVESSAAMDASIDLDTIPQTIARLSVPYLADGCMVDLLEEGGTIRRVGIAAADPSLEPVLRDLQRHRIALAGPHPIARVMRTGRTEIIHDISDRFRKEIADGDDRYYEALCRWPARSIVVAPLKVRGMLHGTIAFASFSPDRPYGLDQISAIEELTARAANAIDNARLFRERGRIARTLEQSLLPPSLPVVPGVELAARFQPVGGGGEVGGDFYDVFDTGETGWAIVIGDVSGRGVDAAAITVLARHTIRAAAMQEPSPARILIVLNEALGSQLEDLRFCSAALGLLRVESSQATLTLASGGHPLPLLVHSNGNVETIGSLGTLLGIVPEPQLANRDFRLSAGDTLVFYTNGVADSRSEDGFGLEQLAALLETCAELGAVATADCIDQAVLDAHKGGVRDDAVILVAKIS